MADEEVIGFNTEEDYVGTIEDTTELIETVYGELDDNAGDDSEVEAVTGQTVSTIDIDLTPAVLPEYEASEFTDTSDTYTPDVGDDLAESDDDEDDDPYTPELPNKISRETMTVVEPIAGEVDAETIAAYNELSADVYAVFTDGTRKQVEWSDVFDPMGDVYSNVAIQGAVVSAAKNQHFWTDTSGVHVTDDDEDSWNTEYAKQNHGSLSTPTVSQPWHNILLNSYGFLLRWGLLNLVQISKSSVAFYTGDGNSSSDILAMFGATQAQIGKSTEKHIVIDSNGVTAYNGDGTIAPMRAYLSGSYIDDSTITGSKIANSTITGSKIASSTIENSNIKDGTITGGKIVGSTLTDIPQAAIVNLSTDYAHITNGTIDNATIYHADVNGLSATYATINNLTAATGRITTLETNTADIATLRANSAKVANLTAQQLEAANAYIASLTAGNVTANDIIADTGKIHNLTAQQLSAAVGYIADLTSASITTTDLIADHGTIGSLDTNYAQVSMANVNNAWIENGTVKNGAISDAMINSVSANKLTAGTIDASNITVTNLNADNITTGTINGQRIGTGSLSLDKLSDDVYTETEVDNLLAIMQSEIDGAIETWTGTVVPTLSNLPASGWNTTADKDKHVGDVYFVVNSQSQQNGYNYRFTKSGNAYSWQLIKDTDITNALSRLSTAEGKITTFDSDITTLKTDTGTLKTKTQSLETRMSDAEDDILDKVDTTTFNEVSDTVDQHSQSITQMSQTLSNKADNSTVTSVTNRVSKTEQDISGINTTISELSTTVESKADGSTVESVSNRLNTVSNTVDGHTQSITSINSTLETKADSSTVSSLTTKVNNVSDTVDGHTQTIGSVQTTQTQMQGKLDKTIVETIQLWYSKSSTDAPGKPTAQVTSTSTAGNAWRTVVPAYNASYPNYFYCYQWKYTDGTYGWSSVTRDIAMGESQERARTAITNAAAADTKAGNAASAAATAQSTANTAASDASEAKTDAASAVSTANIAATDASTALSTANTANTNASSAVSTANTANTNASNAVSTANTAAADASTAKTNASTAVSTANTAKATADKNVKSTLQLWYTKANDTAPDKPTSKVTSNSVSGNAWRVVVPTYSASYPYYFYCYQYELADGTCTWSDVVYDRATTENQSNSRSAVANVSTLTTKTNTISDTVDGHTSQLSSITNTQTSIQGSAVKSTVQLWFTKANTTAPNKPTAHVTTNNASTANAWNLAVPTYNASYPNYFYCYEYEYLNGTYGWSAVTRDIATGEAQSTARTAASDASTAKTNAATAVSTANTANTNASNAVSTANTANTNASSAVSTANTAASDASTAKTNAATAVSTANTASTNASNAVTTANTAKSTADTAKATADKNVKETILLWYSKANSTAPSKPTSAVTSTSTSGNVWSVVVPTYSASYPYYFYCYQYKLADGTYAWSSVVYDQATTEAQSTARAASSSLATYITSNDAAIQSLQNQVDGQIEAWYYSVDPTTSNVPASDWTTDALKARHEGDLYYNVTSGHSWRWLKNGSTYSWQQIPDSDAAAALAAAQNAQNTANNKRRIFTATPTVPYDKGDLWVNGSVVKYSATARSSGNYTASDWSTTATDDTAANAAQATADKNLKESQQLWFTKANSTAPNKPTAKVTSTATTGNAWTTRVPTYNDSYKYYFYCMQYIAADGTVTWSDVIYDQATTEAQSVARAASADLTEFHQEYATFKQTTQQFESTVGETYATKTALQSATDDISSLEDQVGISSAPYTEVEWVESNGSQYVFLDWKPDIATFGFEADFIIRNAFSTAVGAWRPDTNTAGFGSIFGTRNASSVNDIQLSSYGANGLVRFGSGGSASYATAGLFKTDKSRQQISLRGTSLRRGDGTTVTVTRSTGTSDKFYANMMVFAMHEGVRRGATGGLSQPGTVRIYSLKFYDGDTLAVDLVGAIRNRDNTTGLYDKVRGHFYPAPKMTYGDEVGDLGEPDTLAQTIVKKNLVVDIDNQAITRMLSADVPELDKLEDGQQITVTFSSNISSTTPVAAGLVGWDEASTTAYANVFLKLTFADGSDTDWVPCYYNQGTRLTSHYGSAMPISLTYRENVTYGATATSSGTVVMRAWYADPNYYTDEKYTIYSDSVIAGLNGAKPYSLNMRDVNGNWTSVMNEASNANATGKTAYTGGLQLGSILYHNTGSNVAAGNNTGQMKESQGGVDFRYDVNGVTTAAATTQLQLRKPLYFVGTVKDDGYYYLDQTKWWTQTEFETGKVYIQIGTAYGSYYAVFLSVDNPSFIWDGEKLVEYTINKIAESTKQYDSDTETPLVVGDNAATAPLRSYEGAGHAKQFTTTGKNLLQNDGYFPISGTLTDTYFREFNANSRGLPRIEVQAGVTYTLSFDVESSVTPFMISVGLGTGAYLTDVANTAISMQNGRNTITFTPTAEKIEQCGNIFSFRAPRYGSKREFTYSVSNVQLEVGETATDYEPYTGGAPSPSPDYPQEIKVVRGRNLIFKQVSLAMAMLQASSTGYIFIANGTTFIAEVEPSTTYTASVHGGDRRFLAEISSDSPSVSSEVSPFVTTSDPSGAIWSYTFTTSSTAKYVAFYVKNANSTSQLDYAQLELGSVATPYVPYGHVGLEAQGRNLIDVSKSVDGKVVVSTTGAEANSASFRHSDYIPVTANTTYYMSYGLGLSTMHSGAIYDVNKQYLRAISFPGPDNQSGSFNTGEDAAYVILNYFIATHAKYVAPPQLELGSVATAYESYYHTTTAIPLPSRGWVAGLPDGTSDVLTLDSSGKVEWKLPTSKITGEELAKNEYAWIKSTTYSGGYYLYSWVLSNSIPSSSNHLQTHLVTVNSLAKYSIGTCIFEYAALNVRVDDDAYPTLEAFRQWLASSGFELLYPLATPVTEECGYIDMPQVSEGCTISIPELEDSGISWWCKASESMANVTTAIEKRVTTAETSITQTKEQILLKANASDVYTKTQTDGLIETEATNRDAAIQLASNSITSAVSETYSTKTEISDAKTYVANAKANYGYQYMKNIVIYGESSKYYPVYFTNVGTPQTVTHEIMIRREYSEQAPSDWNTSSHKGGLNIHFGWNFGGWGGATYKCEVYEFTQMYSTMVGDIIVGADAGIFSIVYLRGGGTTGALYHVYSDLPFTRQGYMINAGVVGENDVPFIGLEQGVKYAQSVMGDNPTYEWNVRAPLTEPNTTHLNELYTVQRVITAETAIQQTANNVLIKATQSDTTAAQGGQHLIQSLINVAPSGVKIDASKVNITGDAVFSAINNDTGTTKISGGKIDANSITLGYSQITDTPAIPTKTSELTNDSYYATETQAQGYADAKDTAIAAAAKRTYVSIRATAVDYSANTATLEATLYIDGTATTTGVSYKWFMDGAEISGATSRTYSVPASNGLSHAYSCKCTATV